MKIVIGIVLSVLMSFGITFAGPPEFGYTITRIETDSYIESVMPSDINASGEIVGEFNYRDSNDINYTNAFKYDTGTKTFTDLGVFVDGGVFSQSKSINDAGITVGRCSAGDDYTGYVDHAFIYDTGMTDIGLEVGVDEWQLSQALDINNSNQIVGPLHVSAGFDGGFFSYQDGDVQVYEMEGCYRSASKDSYIQINDSGLVVGTYIPNDEVTFFSHRNGVTTNQGSITDSWVQVVTNMNNSGQVVGYAYIRDENNAGDVIHGFSYDIVNEDVSEIFLESSAEFVGINNAGDIVGNPIAGHSFNGGFIAYDSDKDSNGNPVVVELEPMITNIDNWEFLTVRGINDDGVIIGMGDIGDGQYGFYLTPNTEDPDPDPNPDDDSDDSDNGDSGGCFISTILGN